MNIKNFNYSYLFDAQTEYYLTDHLGSIRTTIDQNGAVIGFDDYDPFGNVLPGRSYNLGTPNDLNKFTGHERDQEGGLDLDYMLARNYDSELGRFYSVDPHAIKYPNWSPYTYAYNNPLIYTDPDGRDGVKVSFQASGVVLFKAFGISINFFHDYSENSYGITATISHGLGVSFGAFGSLVNGDTGVDVTHYTGDSPSGTEKSKSIEVDTPVASGTIPVGESTEVGGMVHPKKRTRVEKTGTGQAGTGFAVSVLGNTEYTLYKVKFESKENVQMNRTYSNAPVDALNVIPQKKKKNE